MTHISLVIGNGFDLDLGFPTKYSDFANCLNQEWCDFINMIIKQSFRTEFVNHLQKAREFENWFDIEEEIFKFVKTHENLSLEQIGLIKEQFETLVKKLHLYLCRVAIPKNKRNGTLAEALLHKLNSIQHPVSIYTFNYTNCFEITEIPKSENVKTNPIHGTLKYDMTLGCRPYDGSKENTQLDFMYKPIIGLHKEILMQNLPTATEVIIFGHSLNRMDFCYFKDFFDALESGSHICKYLTFVCKDAISEKSIRQNLNENICLSKIENQVNITFIYTDLWNSNDPSTHNAFEDLCNRIS